MIEDSLSVLAGLRDRAQAGEAVALVTLTDVEGGAPRAPGAVMGVSAGGFQAGYLSGGCLEAAVAEEARQAMAIGRRRRIRYGAGSPYKDIVLPCGGGLDLAIDPLISAADLDQLVRNLDARRPAAWRFDVEGLSPGVVLMGAPAFGWSGTVFTRPFSPRLRLEIAGAGPNAAQLALLAQASGLGVRLWTPDADTRALAEQAGLSVEGLQRPDQVPDFAFDAWTAFATLFHDHDREPALLDAALASPAFFVGAQGGRRAHAARAEALAARGAPADAIARVHAPIGLSPGARSAPELAASALAEILKTARECGWSD
ncbi:MAG: XdhC family protein [Maricaulaceae bacterium]